VPEGDVVIAGARLKVLALVWVSGVLKLDACKDNVANITNIALKQRAELYDDSTLVSFFKSEMLGRASLYNRQILATGLIALTTKSNTEASAIATEVGIEWQEHKLVSYMAALTEFDLHARDGILKPDYSGWTSVVKFVAPMNDRDFDLLLGRFRQLGSN
jgi:hypothetical protein